MFHGIPELNLDQFSVCQKMDLIELLWDSIPRVGEGPPIPQWHLEVLEGRLAAEDSAPEQAISWEQVKARLREKA